MSKRDHDTEIWSEDWFLDLSDLEMLFWYYITDKCDHAGFWRPNFKMFETITGRRINKDDFLKKINTDKDRIIVLENGRWFLSGFISFQYCGKLNLNNRFHKSIMETFRKNIPEEKTTCYNFEVSLTSIRPQVEVNKEQETKNEERRTEEGGLEETKQDHPKNKKSEFIKPSFDEWVPNGLSERKPSDNPPIRGERESKIKEKENKENKENISDASASPEIILKYRECSELLKKRVLEIKQSKITEKTLMTWDRDVRLMLERDNRNLDDIKKIINECHDMEPAKGGFTWRNNILSMGTLRDRWNEGKISIGMNGVAQKSRQDLLLNFLSKG